MQTIAERGDAPLSFTPAFNCDELAVIFGTCLPDAAFVVAGDPARIVAANEKLLGIMGLPRSDLEEADLPAERVVDSRDRERFLAVIRGLLAGHADSHSLEIHLSGDGGRPLRALAHLSIFPRRRERFVLCFARALGDEEARSFRDAEIIEEQKSRAFEAIKSSLRLYQINEKIRRAPTLARKLLHSASEEDLFAEAARVLTSEEGLGYHHAAFLLLEGDNLRVAFATKPWPVTVFPLHGDNRFARKARLTDEPFTDPGAEILLPLESHGHLAGFLEVIPYFKERLFFDESNVVSEWQREFLKDIGGIIALMIDNLRLQREIMRQSRIDSLTQAYNRHHFLEKLVSEVQRAQRYSRPVSALFVDLDEFKLINDKYGHLQGDEVLRGLGKLFLENSRDVDVVCRYGGDEFVILLPETDNAMAQRTADKLLHAIRSTRFPILGAADGEGIAVTVSIGVSTLEPGQTEKDLLRRADQAVYQAKRLGKNRLAGGSGAQT